MWATVAFGISLAALVLFLAFKLFERSHEISAYTSLRQRGDAVVVAAIKRLHHHGSRLEEELSARNVVQKTTHHVATAVAKTARQVEMKAHDVTRKMSRNGAEGRATKSSFLQEVSTHKRSLDTDRVKRETSLTASQEKENLPE